MFDVFYIGENKKLKETVPFAKQIESKNHVKTRTRMYWVIEPNIEIVDYDVLNYRPPEHDQKYEHVWKWNQTNYGGVRLLPKTTSEGLKEINQVICRKTFDILYTSTPGDYFDKTPTASHVWCVDPEYRLSDEINWAPDNFEPNYIHSFHLRNQLEHKYPEEEGGIKLYPKDWKDSAIKYHGFLDAAARYPVLYVEDPSDYTQRNVFDDEYVWLIDKQYKVNEDTLDFVPSPFEEIAVHCFKLPNQLKHKYTGDMGGIRLVPKPSEDIYKWHVEKVHKNCPIQDILYDVFYTNKEFTAETFEFYAKRSETEYFWVVDRDYEFNGNFVFVPEEYEKDYIHVFKVPGFLEYRYFSSVTDLWDNRISGIYFVPKNFDITKKKLHQFESPIKYDLFYTNDINNYEFYARKSRTDMFWLINDSHDFGAEIQWLPQPQQQSYINTFTNGLKLVPKNYDVTKEKFHGSLSQIDVIEFEKYTNEEVGRMSTEQDWFWVIDTDVDVLDDFDFSYVPDEWEKGKTHLWQKLNPITNKQYDYGGVRLCPKNPDSKGRPKYIRSPACVQKTFPVLHLDPDEDFALQARRFEETCEVSMYWMIEPFAYIEEGFDFSYYPTQWDANNVHVFQDRNGSYKNVRIIPRDTFTENDYTMEDILNNSFENMKLMIEVASGSSIWPVIELEDFDRNNFLKEITTYKEKGVPFVWTIDPDVEVYDWILKEEFVPDMRDSHKIHTWQRIAHGHLHSFGGLRLWPTRRDYSDITSHTLEVNKIDDLHYVKQIGARYKEFDIVLLSYHEANAEDAYDRLSNRFDNVIWVRDVEGIFNAHKKAAELSQSKMFWVVDADAEISNDFDFSYVPDVYDHDVVHVWNSYNPVTGQEYGYGGVKLFNRSRVLSSTNWGLDFTTGLSKRFKVMPEVSCTTRFNTDAFSTWRSAFRESVKLTIKDDAESKERLNAWLNPIPESDFSEEAKRGAQMGRDFARSNVNNAKELANINDYSWLNEQYEKRNT